MKPPAPGWSSWCLIFFFRIVPFSDNLLSLSVLAGRARKKAKRRARKKEPTDAEYEFEYVPCPNCETPLEARSWGEKRLRRIEVKTDDSWVLLYIAGEFYCSVSIVYFVLTISFDCIIFFSGDLVLPCCICLAVDDDLSHSDWRKSTMHKEQLQSHMLNRYEFLCKLITFPHDWTSLLLDCSRLRQHLARKHDMLSRNPEVECMRDYAKTLLCPLLHEARGCKVRQKKTRWRVKDEYDIFRVLFPLSHFFLNLI